MTVKYTESSIDEEIICIHLDSSSKRVIMISKLMGKYSSSERILQIFDLKGFRPIFEKKITDSEYSQRLEKENLVIKDGHIYFGNYVIKIRYD